MSGTLTHAHVSAWPESSNALKTRTSDWNANHVMSGGLDYQCLRRDTSTSTGWTWDHPFGTVDVRTYGATGDGTTDDAASIQAAIDASDAGSIIFFPPGVYIVGTAIVFSGSRAYVGTQWSNSSGSQIKQKSGANIAAVFLAESYDSDFSSAGSPVLFKDLYIDGNRANNSALTHGLHLFNFNAQVERVQVRECDGDGFHVEGGAAFIAGSSTCVETWFERCRVFGVGGIGINVVDSTNGKITDGYISNCIIANTTSYGIYIDSSSGWSVGGNHLYGIGRTAIWCVFGYQTDVHGNYIETYGQTVDAGTYYGINISSVQTEDGVIVRGNRINHKSSQGGNTYFGLQIRAANSQASARFLITGNYFRLNGGETGIVLGVGTSSFMEGEVVGNHLYNVGSTKVSQSASVTALHEGNSYNRGTAAPVAGAWPVGLRVWDQAPTPSGTEGWICTTAGSPGTWKTFGTIAA